jgi:hypothetical protein
MFELTAAEPGRFPTVPGLRSTIPHGELLFRLATGQKDMPVFTRRNAFC